MKSVYIDGIGIISRCAMSASDLMEIAGGKAPEIKHGQLEFTSNVPSSKLRRCSRYSKLAAAAAEDARTDGNIPDSIDTTCVGTILSTGFGAADNYIKFSDSVVEGDPALCSPTIFSGIVPNSCVGQICIVNGYKGVSTVLVGGDPMEYTSLLFGGGKADVILCGSVEEYCQELFDSVNSLDAASGSDISEGTVILTVRGEKSADSYCGVSDFSSVLLPVYPLTDKADKKCIKLIADALSGISCKTIPDMVFTSANGTYFDEMEREAMDSVFGNKTVYAYPKKLFGETLGSGYMMSAALAAAVTKTGRASDSFADRTVDTVKTVLVTGIDVAGNYCCMLLEAC